MHRMLFLFTLLLFFTKTHADDLRLFPDSLHEPFIYGVASGDPTTSEVIIWTAVESDNPDAVFTLEWEVALDIDFNNIVANGQVYCDSTTDFTVQTDVSGLNPNAQYYYRFSHENNFSATGITYTAPDGEVDSLSLAVISCSSLFSGYFNAYRQMAAKDNLRAIVHLGDYIYDFVDQNEKIRVPENIPSGINSSDLEGWRERHKLYLLDPDLREARRVLPFILIWDNHDVIKSDPHKSARAFFEFNPIRKPSSDPLRIWRSLRYGDLLEIFLIDMLTKAGDDVFPSGNEKIMTDEQFNWLTDGLKNSTSTWKIMGSQKYFSPWEFGTFESLLPSVGLSKTWDGFAEHRDSLLYFLKNHEIDNFVVVSGDLHMSVWSELSLDPFDENVYDRETGNGSLGLEVMGTSVSRGNLDENGISVSFEDFIYQTSYSMNPQQFYLNLYDHGYTTLTFTPDSLVVKAFINPILTLTEDEFLEKTLTALVNENRWKREDVVETGTSKTERKSMPFRIYPNPAHTSIKVEYPQAVEGSVRLRILNAEGRVVGEQKLSNHISEVSLNRLSPGNYFIVLDTDNARGIKSLVIQ